MRRGPRGVQLEEVVEAADQLLALGLKPTIERVRQRLGGGSPNTVSPLLDSGSSASRPASPECLRRLKTTCQPSFAVPGTTPNMRREPWRARRRRTSVRCWSWGGRTCLPTRRS
ncbi:DNA-binding protein [Variovorax brevis]|uniref:DNA-binding protein n=1 Tax=Variovorax brevis TaxID=3053503 RepID=UPI003365A2EF